jgi:hypothetical protein
VTEIACAQARGGAAIFVTRLTVRSGAQVVECTVNVCS